MSPAARRISFATAALLLLTLGLAGLALGPRGPAAAGPNTPAVLIAEPARLGAEQTATFEFFNQDRDPAPADSGRGLFETDYFKPPPAPPPKPKPTPPTTREIPVFYRGLAAFPDGADVAYLAVETRLITLESGGAVVDGWILSDFNSERAIITKDEEHLALPFNQRIALTVPAQP